MAGTVEHRLRPWLVIFLKEPRPGRVKTRLAKDLGSVRAARWHRRQCLALINRLGPDPRWTTVLAVTPDREGLLSRIWPAHLPRIGQGEGDLGTRMARVMRRLPTGPAIIIGSDTPGATPRRVERAFRLLGRNDAVFGPSPDGGYWLVGLKRSRAVSVHTFRHVRWSSQHALTDSAASLNCRRIGFADTLQDVDTVSDLESAYAEVPFLRSGPSPSRPLSNP